MLYEPPHRLPVASCGVRKWHKRRRIGEEQKVRARRLKQTPIPALAYLAAPQVNSNNIWRQTSPSPPRFGGHGLRLCGLNFLELLLLRRRLVFLAVR